MDNINKYKQKGYEESNNRRWKRSYYRDLYKVYFLN